jgi:ribulose 1,5-bisphosphate synthetase/thiazole synthase
MSEQNKTTLQIIDDNGKPVGGVMCVDSFTIDEPETVEGVVVDETPVQIAQSCVKAMAELNQAIAIAFDRLGESAKEMNEALEKINGGPPPPKRLPPPQGRKKGRVKRW